MKAWLMEIRQREEASPEARVSRISVNELSEREYELLSWVAEQGLPEHQELVQTLLEAGLLRRDLEELARRIEEVTVLPELLALLEFMLNAQAMTCGITSELVRISALIDAIVACSCIDESPHKE